MREAKALQIVEGTNQIQRMVIGRSLAAASRTRVQPDWGGLACGVEETNRKILSLLASDGRLSFTELARQTGLSVSAVQQRVRRLEERGVIRGYSAVIDPARRACR